LAPGYPFTPAVFVLLVLGVVALVAINRPRQAVAGLAIAVLGLPAHRLLFRRYGEGMILIAVFLVGWIWVGSHQPASQAAASRVVLTLGILAGVIGLAVIWRSRPAQQGRSRG
jgi:hypothetical protein